MQGQAPAKFRETPAHLLGARGYDASLHEKDGGHALLTRSQRKYPSVHHQHPPQTDPGYAQGPDTENQSIALFAILTGARVLARGAECEVPRDKILGARRKALKQSVPVT